MNIKSNLKKPNNGSQKQQSPSESKSHWKRCRNQANKNHLSNVPLDQMIRPFRTETSLSNLSKGNGVVIRVGWAAIFLKLLRGGEVLDGPSGKIHCAGQVDVSKQPINTPYRYHPMNHTTHGTVGSRGLASFFSVMYSLCVN